MALRQIIGGGFQDLSGHSIGLGYMTFRLSSDAVVSGVQISSGILTRASLDAGGNISGTVMLWPNDQMIPSNTVYIVKVYTENGELCWQSQQTIPSGTGSFDIGSWVPVF